MSISRDKFPPSRFGRRKFLTGRFAPRVKVFISYRREDSSGHAGRLADALTKEFGPDSVFLDFREIPPGGRFADVIREAVVSSDVALVVIGQHWLTRDAGGARRIDNPKDLVREEVALALSQGARVIPVLVQGAKMPSALELPEELGELAELNAFELSDGRWDYDVKSLTAILRAPLAAPEPGGFFGRVLDAARDLFRTWWGKAALAALLLAAGFAVWRYNSAPPVTSEANADRNAATPTPTSTPPPAGGLPATPSPAAVTATPTPAATPSTAATPAPTPSPAQDAALTALEKCIDRFLPKDRRVSINYGDPIEHVVVAQGHPLGGPAGVRLTESGRPVGAIKFSFSPSGKDVYGKVTGFFKVEGVIGPDCRPVEDYVNLSRVGRKDILADYDYVGMRLGAKLYALRIGYAADDAIKAQFMDKP